MPGILRRHQDWIQERLDELTAQGQGPGQDFLPQTIDLPLSGQRFVVVPSIGEKTALVVQGSTIDLCASDQEQGVLLLQRWLITMGKKVLILLCQDLAQQLNIPITAVSMRTYGPALVSRKKICFKK